MASYPSYQAPLIPSAFIWRRIHSLTGLWLVLFLIEHLLTNSQAALLIGDDGNGFVRAVNFIKELPYLPFIEFLFLAIPFAIHGIWGIRYLFTGQYNSFASDGSKPSLPEYARNQAYSWQRITSWILFFGVIAHVIHMRFLEYPNSAQLGTQHYYIGRLSTDEGLFPLSKRLGFELYDEKEIQQKKEFILSQSIQPTISNPTSKDLINLQDAKQKRDWIAALEKWPLKKNEILAVSPTFGTAELLLVRDTFKNPLMILLYTVFVLAACFHAFNGLWTFMISWGITLTARSQSLMRGIANVLMILITALGLAAIWGTYWFNLSQ